MHERGRGLWGMLALGGLGILLLLFGLGSPTAQAPAAWTPEPPADERSTPARANTPPAAAAGLPQTVRVGDLVTLDGSRSSDADGDALTYFWTLQRPPDSRAALSDPTAVRPTFTVDWPGIYTARLLVHDGQTNSAPATVVLGTENSPPVADAGPAQTLRVGATVTLDGRRSRDVDGDELGFAWSFVGRPADSAATLAGADTVQPSFTVDRPGEYTVRLIVHDGQAASAPATVVLSTENSPPVAAAGPHQSALVGATVTLDGSRSADVDGDPLDFTWSFLSRPAGSTAVLSDPHAIQPHFTLDQPGDYVVQLRVADGAAASVDTVTVTTGNAPPVADAGPDQTVPLGATVALDGGGSTDPDRDALGFRWALTAVPAHSTAALDDPTAVAPTFVADRPGTYVAQLIVHDGTAASAPATVRVSTENSRPVAVAGPVPTALVGETVTLNGGGSTDADDDPLAYAWALLATPAESAAALNGADQVQTTFVPDVAGAYLAQLRVHDGASDSVPATVLVTATAPAARPSASAGAAPLARDSSATDRDPAADPEAPAAPKRPARDDPPPRFSATATCPYDDHLVLQNQTLAGAATFRACQTLTAGPAFTVSATGAATFEAGQRIILRPGFRVQAGGTLTARLGSGLQPTELYPRIEFVSDQLLLFEGAGEQADIVVRVLDADGAEIPDAQVNWIAPPGPLAIAPLGPSSARVFAEESWSGTRTILVEYPPLGITAEAYAVIAVLAPETVRLPSDDLILDIEGDRADNHRLILRRTPETEALQVGQILLSGDLAGIMVHILVVTLESDRVILDVEPALITEAIKEIDLMIEGEPLELTLHATRQATTMTLRSLPDGHIMQHKVLPQFNLLDNLECSGSVDLGILDITTLTLTQTLIPRAGLSIGLIPPRVTDFLLLIEGEIGIQAGFSVNLGGGATISGECAVEAPEIRLGSIPVYFFFTLQPTLKPKAGVKLEATAEGSVQLTPPVLDRRWWAKAGVRYTAAHGWDIINESGTADHSGEGVTGMLQGGVQFKAELFKELSLSKKFNIGRGRWGRELISVEFFKFGGGPYWQIGIDSPVDPLQAAYTGPTVEVGVEASAEAGIKVNLIERLARHIPLSLTADISFTVFSQAFTGYRTAKPSGNLTCSPDCNSVPADGSGSVTLSAQADDTATGTVEFWASVDDAEPLIKLASVPFSGGQAVAVFTPDESTEGGTYTVYPRLKLDGALSAYTHLLPLASEQKEIGEFSVEKEHIVTAIAGANGSVTPASRTVSHGATTTFTIVPNSGYIACVTGCDGTLAGNTYTTGPITAACTVTATFFDDQGLISCRYQPIGVEGEIIRDLVTGLEWQRCSVGQTWNPNTQRCEGQAGTFVWSQADALTAPGGFRLPTIMQLRSLRYCSNTGIIGVQEPVLVPSGGCGESGTYQSPTIVWEAFPDTPPHRFWSATPSPNPWNSAWLVNFYFGAIHGHDQSFSYRVRLVRGYCENIFCL